MTRKARDVATLLKNSWRDGTCDGNSQNVFLFSSFFFFFIFSFFFCFSFLSRLRLFARLLLASIRTCIIAKDHFHPTTLFIDRIHTQYFVNIMAQGAPTVQH